MPDRIQRLPTDLVNQIAAGEVVERPASVVKELVENAIDAGATTIDLVLENGGRDLIEVADDGCGMSERDAVTALERHATSKIRSFDELVAVRTLGFRGEALPSIASVSRFELTTSDGEGLHATCVTVTPGGELRVVPAARDRGTTVRVEQLFANVPARRKFLKSVDAEYRAIVAVVSSYALTAAARSFRVAHNGRIVLELPRAGSLRERALQILGPRAERDLVAIDCRIEQVEVSGYVSREASVGSRRSQYLFVNDRLVKDRVLTHAANRAVEMFDAERFPALILYVAIPPDGVDVNVHPAKTEVRFRDSGQVHVAVEHAIRTALGAPARGERLLSALAPEAATTFPAPLADGRAIPLPLPLDVSLALRETGSPLGGEASPLFSRSSAVVQPPRWEPHELGDLQGRVIGQYRDSYILIDAPSGLRIIDQHAAHERVLYERLQREQASSVSTQRLLEPLLYEAGAAEGALLEGHAAELRAVGFEIERFSGTTFAVTEIPAMLLRENVERFLRKLVDAAAEGRRSHLDQVRHAIAATLACHAAIKVHRPLGGQEMAQLFSDLLECENPFACPHGRPVIVDIGQTDIEKHFHRR